MSRRTMHTIHDENVDRIVAELRFIWGALFVLIGVLAIGANR